MENNIELTGTDKKYSKTEIDKSKTKILQIVGSEIAFDQRVINDRDQLKWVVGVLKQEGLTIVYTSGVYDLIHIGHLKYLEEARKLGNIVIIGVDSDELTRQRKADIPNRPIVPLSERLETLAYARAGHIFTIRDTDEHEDQLIVDILPDVVLFSRSTKDVNDFEKKIRSNLSSFCGKIEFLDAQAQVSTTGRIRMLTMDGANGLEKVITTAIASYFTPEAKGENK